MSNPKKFGAFAGVFTPSILTILGVIMYLRLGWVVGEAGLVGAIIIILVSHIISVSTGLSISSISTDKKIKTGGIYYILSRSLGLPMGGAIGIALFIGTAFSISLYLIGFAESLLSVEMIREFTGLEQNLDGYRIVGSVAILMLVLIAFISTSLAIKTQFYILGAIGLSLVSIFVGFFINSDFSISDISINARPGGVPIAVIFGVFFPAVTGFTAGVAMSGDLKDPKKSIPTGTLGAITVGFIIYMALAIGLAIFVDRDLLVENPNFLLKIAWFAPLVLLGIWGATLSSALGGILGAPRIIQATSLDRITPRFLGKGYGVNNEPRNGLIFVFLIAECGILLGELNLVAEIVSMFYLASYGFINFAFYLESWASTDFRPSFKVNKYIGLVGFIAAFAVMFQINMVSMIAALVIMLGIFFFLKRKQVKLDYGDVWQSVWSSIVRTALHRIDNSILEERNWQPNIILFSGGTDKRPHLIELGKAFVGKHGVLSNFDLIETDADDVLFPKHAQSINGKEESKAVFTRRQSVSDIYDGIEMIARTYGFSGVEPNTIILGWARQTKHPVRFTRLLKILYDLDLNVLLLDYDQRKGFGKSNKIDIWWQGEGKSGNLALTLSKFMLMSDQWSEAEIRLLIVNNQNEMYDRIFRKVHETINQMRIDAHVKIINNQYDQQAFYEIIKKESISSDLVFFAIPEIIEGKEAAFVSSTNDLLHAIGTVVLVNASSKFKNLHLGELVIQSNEKSVVNPSIKSVKPSMEQVKFPEQESLKKPLTELFNGFHDTFFSFTNKFLKPVLQVDQSMIKEFQEEVNEIFSSMEYLQTVLKKEELKKKISQYETNILLKQIKYLEKQQDVFNQEITDVFEVGLQELEKTFKRLIDVLPEEISMQITSQQLKIQQNDGVSTRFFKLSRRIFGGKELKNNGLTYHVRFQLLVIGIFRELFLEAYQEVFDQYGNLLIRNLHGYGQIIRRVKFSADHLFKMKDKKHLQNILIKEKESIDNAFSEHEQSLNNCQQELMDVFIGKIVSGFNVLEELSYSPPLNRYITKPSRKNLQQLNNQFLNLPRFFIRNRHILHSSLIAEIHLLILAYRIKRLFIQVEKESKALVEQMILYDQNLVLSYLEKIKVSIDEGLDISSEVKLFFENYDETTFRLGIKKIIDRTTRSLGSIATKLPEEIKLTDEDIYSDLESNQFESIKLNSINLNKYVNYQIQNFLTEGLITFQQNLLEQMHPLVQQVKDSLRLLDFGSKLDEFDEGGITNEVNLLNLKRFVKDQTLQIKGLMVSISQILEESLLELNTSKNRVLDELTINHLYTKGESYSRAVKKKVRERRVEKFQKKIKHWGKLYQLQVSDWMYKAVEESSGKSQPLPFENKMLDGLWNYRSVLSNPSDKGKVIPFYYRQLFLNKQNFQSEFLFGREEEIIQAENAIAIFKKRLGGGLLISGERFSGKTYFTHYISQTFLKKEKVIFINPPANGSIKVSDFDTEFTGVLNKKGSASDILSQLPRACIVLDNIELWWDRSEVGGKVIEYIAELLHRFSKKHFFVCIANNHVLWLLNQQQDFQKLFIANIVMKPLASKAMAEAIMFRHRTGGIGLKIVTDNKIHKLNEINKAKIFSKIYELSGGNIGIALHLWIYTIREMKKNNLLVSPLMVETVKGFDELPSWIRLLLIQFLIHKRLSVVKLMRVTKENKSEVKKKLAHLTRLELIQQVEQDVFELQIDIFRFIEDQIGQE